MRRHRATRASLRKSIDPLGRALAVFRGGTLARRCNARARPHGRRIPPVRARSSVLLPRWFAGARPSEARVFSTQHGQRIAQFRGAWSDEDMHAARRGAGESAWRRRRRDLFIDACIVLHVDQQTGRGCFEAGHVGSSPSAASNAPASAGGCAATAGSAQAPAHFAGKLIRDRADDDLHRVVRSANDAASRRVSAARLVDRVLAHDGNA